MRALLVLVGFLHAAQPLEGGAAGLTSVFVQRHLRLSLPDDLAGPRVTAYRPACAAAAFASAQMIRPGRNGEARSGWYGSTRTV